MKRNVDLRTAAYINAITKLDEYYSVAGIRWYYLLIIQIMLYLIGILEYYH